MTILYGAQGSGVTGSTSLAVPYPALPEAGELFLLVVVNKYPTNGPSTPAGWTLVKQESGGAGASGVDQGSVYLTVFSKVSDGTETGNVTVTITGGNSACGRMTRYEKDLANSWDVAAVSAPVNTATASWSVAMGSNPGIAAGDFVVAYTGINTDAYTASAHAISAPGVSAWGTVTQRNDFGTGFGDDTRFTQSDHPVTTGTASGAATYSMTESGSSGNAPAGAVILVRLREVAGGITADLNATLGDVTSAAAGVLPIHGAAAPTLGALSLGSSAALAIVGASGPTLGAVALAATGVHTPIAGAASPTLEALTASAAAKVSLAASATSTLAPVACTAAAALRIAAVASPTLADLACASTTALAVKAAAALQLADATSSAAGALPIVGAATVALQALTCAASGELELAAGTGTVAEALADLTVASVSKLPIAAAATPTLGTLTSAAQAAVAIRGTLGVTLGAATLVAAGGVVSGAGEVDATLGAMSCSAVARLAIAAASAQALEPAALASTGRAALVGSASITLGDCTIHATGADSSTVPPVIGARRNAQRQQQAGRRPQIDAGIRRRN